MLTLRGFIVVMVGLASTLGMGCSSVRVTDPPRTATEMLLLSQAATEAVGKIAVEALRDRKVFVDTTYLLQEDRNRDPKADQLFLLGEIRARLLREGVRLVQTRPAAEIILEVRSGALGIDKQNLLIGLPSVAMPALAGSTSGVSGDPVIAIPEIALIKNVKQDGVVSVAIVAYWSDSGELVATSGPFTGRTYRDDWWFFGYGPRTSGDIPTARPRPTTTTQPAGGSP
jgi:hypothetical protein